MIYLWNADIRSLIIYMSCILMSFLFVHFYSNQKRADDFVHKWLNYILISIPVALFIGFRGRTTGADTATYIRHFFNYDTINYGEITYKLFLLLSNYIGKGRYYTVLFLIYSFITMIFLVATLDIYIDNKKLNCALFMFYSFLGLYMADQMRQLASVTLSFFGCALLQKRKYLLGCIWTVLATLMHISSLVVLAGWILFYVLRNRSRVIFIYGNGNIRFVVNLRVFIFAFIVSFALPHFYIPLFRICAIIVPERFKQYFTTRVFVQKIGWGLLVDIMPLIFLILFAWQYGKKEMAENEWLYDFAMLLLPFRIIGYFSYFIARLIYYPILACIILISAKAAKSKKVLCAAIIMSIGYFSITYMYFDLHDIFPYVTFWEMF